MRWQEAEMSGILNKFRVEHGTYGVRVLARSHELTGGCNSDAEIDNVIQMLKDDLDGCAREMKRLVKLNRSGSLFEGWPSARDEVIEG
jgi:hypothetical protein